MFPPEDAMQDRGSTSSSGFGERLYTVKELAPMYGWSYDTTVRYFRRTDGVMRQPGMRTRILVPESVARREWDRLTRRVRVQTGVTQAYSAHRS